jgi:hypothetical protein
VTVIERVGLDDGAGVGVADPEQEAVHTPEASHAKAHAAQAKAVVLPTGEYGINDGHGVQDPAPGTSLKVPTAQGTGAVTPRGHAVPTGHNVPPGSVAPSVHTRPTTCLQAPLHDGDVRPAVQP